MKISAQRSQALYAAIHRSLVDTRIALKLPPQADGELAQLEQILWQRVCEALGIQR